MFLKNGSGKGLPKNEILHLILSVPPLYATAAELQFNEIDQHK